MDDLLHCTACLNYYDTEECVPRLLPCNHTLCHSCLRLLLRGGEISCPECKARYKAENDVFSFPVNNYIIILIKRKNPHEVIEIHHGGCNPRNSFLETIDTLCKDLQSSRQKLLTTKEQSTDKNLACLTKLKDLKDKFVEQFDGMIKHVEDQTKDTQNTVDNDVAAIDESIKREYRATMEEEIVRNPSSGIT